MTLYFLAMLEDESDKEYITGLYQTYYPLMKKRAYSITRDYNVVDDLIQDAFLKLIPKIHLLRSLNCYKTTSYLVYTIKHVCIDYIRKKARYDKHAYSGSSEDIADLIPDLQAATEENYIQDEENENIEKALFQLSERDRHLLYFKYNMGMSDKEIAKMLDIPVQHVRQYAARARHRAFDILSNGGEHFAQDE